MRTIPDVPTIPVGRTSRWDTSISPQERKRRHEAAERERKQRNARQSAERAKLARKSAEARSPIDDAAIYRDRNYGWARAFATPRPFGRRA